MAGIGIRLTLVVAICFSWLVLMNGAIPITRSLKLMQQPHSDREATKTLLSENWKAEVGERRMEYEVTDYPGSGANNRHTPRAQVASEERLH